MPDALPTGASVENLKKQAKSLLRLHQHGDVAAFPVEAQATTFARRASARATPTALARSLSDPVGLRDSSFTRRRRTPTQRARAAGSRSGVPPGVAGGTRPPGRNGSSSV